MAEQLAVLGSPIGHSLSPVLHRAAYKALGLPWTYDAHEVARGELRPFLAGLDTTWRGLSLTMPLKQEALGVVDELDRVAELTDAVNTLSLRHTQGTTRIAGYNTDVAGLVRALREAGVDTVHRTVHHAALLGAGATASSALVALAELGSTQVDVYVRTPEKAGFLISLGRSLGVGVNARSLDELPGASAELTLVISTLPGGTRLEYDFPVSIRATAVLFDVSYSPWPSTLADSWLKAGGTVHSGVTMLLHQALVQVRIFVSGSPLIELNDEGTVLQAMRDALHGALQARQQESAHSTTGIKTTPPAVKE